MDGDGPERDSFVEIGEAEYEGTGFFGEAFEFSQIRMAEASKIF
jgi:hypothetical protein